MTKRFPFLSRRAPALHLFRGKTQENRPLPACDSAVPKRHRKRASGPCPADLPYRIPRSAAPLHGKKAFRATGSDQFPSGHILQKTPPHSKIASALRAQNNRLQRVAQRNGLSPALRAHPASGAVLRMYFLFRGPEKGSRPATARKDLPASPAPVASRSAHPARPVFLFPFPSPLHSAPCPPPDHKKNALRLSTKRAFLRSLRPVPGQSLRTEPRRARGIPDLSGNPPHAFPAFYVFSAFTPLRRAFSAVP